MRIKRMIAFVLAFIMVMGNTVTASATSVNSSPIGGDYTIAASDTDMWEQYIAMTEEATTDEAPEVTTDEAPEVITDGTLEAMAEEETETTTQEPTLAAPLYEEEITGAEGDLSETDAIQDIGENVKLQYAPTFDDVYYGRDVVKTIYFATIGQAVQKVNDIVATEESGIDWYYEIHLVESVDGSTPSFSVSGNDMVTDASLGDGCKLYMNGYDITLTADAGARVRTDIDTTGDTGSRIFVESGVTFQILAANVTTPNMSITTELSGMDFVFEDENPTLIVGDPDRKGGSERTGEGVSLFGVQMPDDINLEIYDKFITAVGEDTRFHSIKIAADSQYDEMESGDYIITREMVMFSGNCPVVANTIELETMADFEGGLIVDTLRLKGNSKMNLHSDADVKTIATYPDESGSSMPWIVLYEGYEEIANAMGESEYRVAYTGKVNVSERVSLYSKEEPLYLTRLFINGDLAGKDSIYLEPGDEIGVMGENVSEKDFYVPEDVFGSYPLAFKEVDGKRVLCVPEFSFVVTAGEYKHGADPVYRAVSFEDAIKYIKADTSGNTNYWIHLRDDMQIGEDIDFSSIPNKIIGINLDGHTLDVTDSICIRAAALDGGTVNVATDKTLSFLSSGNNKSNKVTLEQTSFVFSDDSVTGGVVFGQKDKEDEIHVMVPFIPGYYSTNTGFYNTEDLSLTVYGNVQYMKDAALRHMSGLSTDGELAHVALEFGTITISHRDEDGKYSANLLMGVPIKAGTVNLEGKWEAYSLEANDFSVVTGSELTISRDAFISNTEVKQAVSHKRSGVDITLVDSYNKNQGKLLKEAGITFAESFTKDENTYIGFKKKANEFTISDTEEITVKTNDGKSVFANGATVAFVDATSLDEGLLAKDNFKILSLNGKAFCLDWEKTDTENVYRLVAYEDTNDIRLEDENGLGRGFTSLDEVKKYVMKIGDANASYTIFLNKNLTVSEEELVYDTAYAKSVELYLNDHSITFEKNCNVKLDGIRGYLFDEETGESVDKPNSKLIIGKNTVTFLPRRQMEEGKSAKEILLSDLTVVADKEVPGSIVLGDANDIINSYVDCTEISFTNKIKDLSLYGDVYIYNDSTLTVTNQIYVKNTSDEVAGIRQEACFDGWSVTTNSLDAREGELAVGAFEVTGNSYFTAGNTLTVLPLTSTYLNNIEIDARNQGLDTPLYVNFKTTIHLNPEEYVKEPVFANGDKLEYGHLTIYGKITSNKSLYNPIELNRYWICEWSWDEYDKDGNFIDFHDEIRKEQDPFADGDTVVIAMDKATTAKYFSISGENRCTKKEGNKIKADSVKVLVRSYEDGTDIGYTSLEDAAKNMQNDFGGVEGRYKILVCSDLKLKGNVVLPAFAKEIIFTASDAFTLDFNGYKISTPGTFVLDKEEHVLKNSVIEAGTLLVPAGNRSIDTLSVGTLDLTDPRSATITINKLKAAESVNVSDKDVLRINTATGIKDVELEKGALLVVNNFTQAKSGKTYAWAGSAFVINETATIYNPVLNAKENVIEPVHIYKTENAKIKLLGRLTRTAPQTLLSIGQLADKVDIKTGVAENITLLDYTKKTALFDTKIAGFSLDVVEAKQASADSAFGYDVIYKIGDTVCVGMLAFKAFATTEDGMPLEEKSFVMWADAVAYLNTAGKNAECIIEVVDSVETMENFKLPGKASSIVIRAAWPENAEHTDRIKLTYLGDISLSSATRIEDIHLVAKKYNTKKSVYEDYKSTWKLNGKELVLKNASAQLSAVAGNAKAVLTMDGSEITVAKAVSSLGFLNMKDSKLKAHSVVVTDTLAMDFAKIDCVSKITLNNITSKGEHNGLSYGGNGSNNSLTVKGNITFAEDANKEVGVSRETEETLIIRKDAITLEVKAMEENGYLAGAVLCNAAKATPSCFVVGSRYNEAKERTFVLFGTHKKNKKIYCGEAQANVNLYSSPTGAADSFVLEGTFNTLQDALTEINNISLKENYYQVELMKADKEVVTSASKTLTFPGKVKELTIRADCSATGTLSEPKIYFKGNIVLKSNTRFEEIVFVPSKAAGISLGNYRLELSECRINPDNPAAIWNKISGSGIKKDSVLLLNDTVMLVNGNVDNVGKLIFASNQDEEAKLVTYGKINVGNIELATDAILAGSATVTRKKVSGDNTVTKIVPKVTINGDVISADGNTLYLDLYEKAGQGYRQLDFDNNDMGAMERSGIRMAKAQLVTYPNIKALQRSEDDARLIKSAGYLLWYPGKDTAGKSAYGAELKFISDNGEVSIPCLTFGDAVTEINNRKNKRDYTIELTEAGNELSGAEQTVSAFVPKEIKMPDTKYIRSLTVEGSEIADVQLGYLGNIAFTCDTTLKDIDFVQMVKVQNKYLTMDEAKRDYPDAVTVSTGGYALNVQGVVTFNTPVIFDGKDTGSLTLNGEGITAGTITTLTNGNNAVSSVENLIYGSITAFDTLEVNDCDLKLSAYKTSAKQNAYKPVANKVANLKLTGGEMLVYDEQAKSSLTVTGNADMDGATLTVGGKLNLKNVTLGAIAGIQADKEFVIGGRLISKSDDSILVTRRKGKGQAPYLNIKGEVVCEDSNPVYVAVFPDNESKKKDDTPVKLVNAPAATGQLLTAKKAPAEAFRPVDKNTNGQGAYNSESNPGGYRVKKIGSNIYVYEGK